MKKKAKEFQLYPLMGKWIIAFDTIVDGWQCVQDENEKPVLYDSHDEAVKEIFGDNLSMLSNRSASELKEFNEGVTKVLIKQMSKIFDGGDVKAMEEFMNKHPECDDSQEFIVPAEEFIKNRKAIFGNEGLKITGTPAKELF